MNGSVVIHDSTPNVIEEDDDDSPISSLIDAEDDEDEDDEEAMIKRILQSNDGDDFYAELTTLYDRFVKGGWIHLLFPRFIACLSAMFAADSEPTLV